MIEQPLLPYCSTVHVNFVVFEVWTADIRGASLHTQPPSSTRKACLLLLFDVLALLRPAPDSPPLLSAVLLAAAMSDAMECLQCSRIFWSRHFVLQSSCIMQTISAGQIGCL